MPGSLSAIGGTLTAVGGTLTELGSQAYNFVFEGDSLTDSSNIPWWVYFSDMVIADGADVTATKKAVTGSTMNEVIARGAADDALLDPDAANYIFLLCGYNDRAGYNHSLATMEANFTSWVAAREAAGWTVILLTHPANWGLVRADDRLAFNTFIRGLGPDFFDLAANPDVGTQGNYLPPYWASHDLVHPWIQGHMAFGSIAYSDWRAIQGLSTVTVIETFDPVQEEATAEVVIQGRGFTGATSVTFNGVEATAFTVDTDRQITATLPVTTTGPVSVTSPTGVGTSPFDFMYAPALQAEITSYTVANLADVGAYRQNYVTVNGSNLASVNGATFTGPGLTRVTAATSSFSNTYVNVFIPANVIEGPIVVTTASAGVAVSPDYVPSTAAPVWQSALTNPGGVDHGYPGQRILAKIKGAAGNVGTTPTITAEREGGGAPVTLSLVSLQSSRDVYIHLPKSVEAKVGANTFTFTNEFGSCTGTWTVDAPPTPTITSLNKTTVGQGSPGITVTGTGFWTATAVTIDGTPAASWQVSTDAALYFECGLAHVGTGRKVTITNPTGSVESTATFTVT